MSIVDLVSSFLFIVMTFRISLYAIYVRRGNEAKFP